MRKKLQNIRKTGICVLGAVLFLSGCSLQETIVENLKKDTQVTEPESVWEEDSEKTEAMKKLYVSGYRGKTIGEALVEPYHVVEWKVKEEDGKQYLLCNYTFENKSRSIVFYQDEYRNVNVAEYSIAGRRQNQEETEKCLLTMFGAPQEEEATPEPTEEPQATPEPTPEPTEEPPVSAGGKLYPGDYPDIRSYGDDPSCPAAPCSVVISNVTDTSFDFKIMQYNPNSGNSELIFKPHTAVFNDDGMTATYFGKQYTLTFTFPDITSLQISGFSPVEGCTFANNSIPGHEFS